jgi:dephospho-CoA kinase
VTSQTSEKSDGSHEAGASIAPAIARSKRKPIIGVIGGVGSGKSTVARAFVAHSCGLVDADALSHDAMRQPAVRDELVRWWGESVISSDGQIDRKAVGRIVFASPAPPEVNASVNSGATPESNPESSTELLRLEALLHPIIAAGRAAAHQKFEADERIVAIVEDSPLLLEKGLDGACDVIVFVRASKAARLARVGSSRRWSEKELESREAKQLPLDIKARRADYVIDNDLPVSAVDEQVRRVLSKTH